MGVSTQDILKAGNWSLESTFCRFYHRPTLSTERSGPKMVSKIPKQSDEDELYEEELDTWKFSFPPLTIPLLFYTLIGW